jgi:hypothetical protein
MALFPSFTITLSAFYLGGGGWNVINIQTEGTGRPSDATLKNVDHTNISINAVIVTLIFFK